MEAMIQPPRTGLQAFELLPEGTRCQLINDAIIMSPAPNLPHALIQAELFNAVYNYVTKHLLGKVVCAPVDVYLNNTNVYQPDLLYVSNQRKEILKNSGVFGAPDLVIEILSTDRRYDLVTKKKVYEKAGVQEYWMVDPDTRWCEGFVLRNNKFVSLGESTGQCTIEMFGLTINF